MLWSLPLKQSCILEPITWAKEGMKMPLLPIIAPETEKAKIQQQIKTKRLWWDQRTDDQILQVISSMKQWFMKTFEIMLQSELIVIILPFQPKNNYSS